jgi:hypothetical protein
LAHAQLDQPGDAVFDHLTLFAEVVELRAALPSAGSLELGLLGVQAYVPSMLVADRPLEAPRTQRAVAANLGRESESVHLGSPASRRLVEFIPR